MGAKAPTLSMLSYLDPILYPDECEVLEVSHNRYVYPIFKNGSSSLLNSNFRSLSLSEIEQLETIEVFIRDPLDRYVSGVQTFLRFNPEYAREATLKLIHEYLFLNRHFTLQFHWLVNLARYTTASITIRPIEELSTATDLTWHQLSRDQRLINEFSAYVNLHYYLLLDKVLRHDLLGMTVTFKEILAHIQTFYPDLYNDIIQRSKNLCAVLG